MIVASKSQRNWLPLVLNALQNIGYAVVTDVLSSSVIERTRASMYEVQRKMLEELGSERLAKAGELGVLRLMMRYDAFFTTLLEICELLAVVDQTVSSTAILHLQNGFILPSFQRCDTPSVFQNKFHMDFPRVLNGYLLSVNIFFTITEFTSESGGTLVVPGSHQKSTPPEESYMQKAAIPVECPPGSMIVFDSTLWHAAGRNTSGQDRLGINHQFTRSYIKQQIDYVRALGCARVQQCPPRTQQLLGSYTQVVTSLDEYYRPESERLYRRGQG